MPGSIESDVRFRPPRPDFIMGLPPPRTGGLSPVRRAAKRLIFAAVDGGWFGLRPLRDHVIICGFQRSGSTLLLLMAETCVADAKVFGTEVSGLATARLTLRNHPYVITKNPGDVFEIDEIRAFYAPRNARARFVLTVRDPRAVLTSKHELHPDRQPGGYYEIPEEWLAYYHQVRYAQQFDDVLTIRYEDLVADPGEVQRRLTDFIGWEVRLPFSQFHAHASLEFKFSFVLNGLRPADPTRIASWQRPEHHERIRSVLRAFPKLPDYLVEMGYERDAEWAGEYL